VLQQHRREHPLPQPSQQHDTQTEAHLSQWRRIFWLTVRARRDSMNITRINIFNVRINFNRSACSYIIKTEFFLLYRTQFRRQLTLKNGAAYSKVHMYNFRLFYSQIIIRSRVIYNAYALSTAPCSLATYFGPLLLYVYNFITRGLR